MSIARIYLDTFHASHPGKRIRNSMLRDFIAIDFETANQEPSSVCSVGVVMVRDGQIVDSFYSPIQPEPNYYNYWCQRVHGISQAVRPVAAQSSAANRSFCLWLQPRKPSPCYGRCRSLCRDGIVSVIRNRPFITFPYIISQTFGRIINNLYLCGVK